MRKRKIKFGKLLLLLMILILIAGGGFGVYHFFFKERVPEQLLELDVNNKHIGTLTRIYEKKEGFVVDIVYPKINKKSDAIIEDYINNNIENHATLSKPDTYLLFEYESFKSGNNYSVLLYKATGDNIGELSYQFDKTFNFDTNGNIILSLESLFEKGYLKQLAGLLREAYHNEFEGLPPLKYFKRLSASKSNFEDFYFDEDKIYFRIETKDLFTHSSKDILERAVKISDLAYYLKEDYPLDNPILKTNTNERPVRYVDLSKPLVAMTFDDGPSGESTKTIIETLNKHHQKGTFFLLGHNIENNSELVKLMAESGHQIGNHSYNHKDFLHLSKTDIKWQLETTNDLIEKYTGKRATVVRLPYGSGYAPRSNHVLNNVPYPMAFWSIDTNDWQPDRKDSELLKNYIINQVKDGSIVLLHDVYYTSAQATVKVVPLLIEKGYQLVTIEELALFRELPDYKPHKTILDGYKDN